MILIPCIHCGPRNVSEFRYMGELGRSRPAPDAATREAWSTYLYARSNRLGWTTERWLHASGCRRFLDIERHTGTNEIRAARPPGPATEAS